jgi:hypothetical protein
VWLLIAACNLVPLPASLAVAGIDFWAPCRLPLQAWLLVQAAVSLADLAWAARLLAYLRERRAHFFTGCGSPTAGSPG